MSDPSQNEFCDPEIKSFTSTFASGSPDTDGAASYCSSCTMSRKYERQETLFSEPHVPSDHRRVDTCLPAIRTQRGRKAFGRFLNRLNLNVRLHLNNMSWVRTAAVIDWVLLFIRVCLGCKINPIPTQRDTERHTHGNKTRCSVGRAQGLPFRRGFTF